MIKELTHQTGFQLIKRSIRDRWTLATGIIHFLQCLWGTQRHDEVMPYIIKMNDLQTVWEHELHLPHFI